MQMNGSVTANCRVKCKQVGARDPGMPPCLGWVLPLLFSLPRFSHAGFPLLFSELRFGSFLASSVRGQRGPRFHSICPAKNGLTPDSSQVTLAIDSPYGPRRLLMLEAPGLRSGLPPFGACRPSTWTGTAPKPQPTPATFPAWAGCRLVPCPTISAASWRAVEEMAGACTGSRSSPGP